MVATFDGSAFLQGANMQIQDRQNLMNNFSRLLYGMQQNKIRQDAIARAEAKDAAAQAMDPQTILADIEMGKDVSPDRMARLKAWDKMNTSKMGQDQWGRTYQANRSVLPSQTPDIVSQGRNTFGAVAGTPPIVPNDMPIQDVQPQSGVYQSLNPMAQTPAGQMESFKNELDIQKDIIMDERKADREREAEAGKEKLSLENQAAQLDSLDEEIDRAIEQTDWKSAGAASFTGMVGGTPAADLEARLNTITSDAALGRLAELKKEGGTLGAVSEKELALLGSAITGLTQSQSPEQLRFNLKKYKRVRRESFERVADAYKKKYGTDIDFAASIPQETEQSSNPSQTRKDLSQYSLEELKAMVK